MGEFKTIQRYVEDLKTYVVTLPEDSRASTQAWLNWCEEHINDHHPLHGLGMPKVSPVRGYERDNLVTELARRIHISDTEVNARY